MADVNWGKDDEVVDWGLEDPVEERPHPRWDPPRDWWDQTAPLDAEAPEMPAGPAAPVRPQARPDGLTAPDAPDPEAPVPPQDIPETDPQPPEQMRGRGGEMIPKTAPQVEVEDQSEVTGQSRLAEAGKRFARGATEVGASLPEAAALAGAGNPNEAALVADEIITRSQEQINLAEQRLRDNPDIDPETRARIENVISQEKRTIDAYRPLVEIAEGPLKPAAKDRPLFKRGEKIREASRDLFGTPDPQFDDRFWAKLSEGAGSMVGFIGVTLTTGLVGGAAAGSGLNASAMYREALEYGATEEEAKTAAYLGALVGTTEVAPIGRALSRFSKPAQNRVTRALARRALSAAESAGEEGIQEAGVTIMNNLIAKGIYDPERGWSEGAGEDALIGAILGGGIGAVTPSPAGPGRPARDEEPPEDGPPPESYLTPEDRAAAQPDDVIGEGKKIIDEIVGQKNRPTPPQAGVPPLDEAAANVRVPPQDDAQGPLPTDRLSPTQPAPAAPGTAPQTPQQAPTPEAETAAPAQPAAEDAGQAVPEPASQPQAPDVDRTPPTAPEAPSRAAEPPEADTAPADVPWGRDDQPADAQEAGPAAPDIIPPKDITADTEVEMSIGDDAPVPGTIVRTTEEGTVFRDRDGEEFVVPAEDIEDGETVFHRPGTAPRYDNEGEIVPRETDEQARQTAQPAPESATTQPARPDQGRTGGTVVTLQNEDLTAIETDPETFQYKSGADTEGVTGRLRGVREWDTTRAGTAIVYEYADGRRVIVDGHQRLALAREMRARGQDVELPVIIRREADGYTPEEVMVNAALKNIAESPNVANADPQLTVDAAKVMRSRPKMTVEEMNLPPRSAMVRHAGNLRNLSDDAFGMLVNDTDMLRNASAVGKVVQDQSVHADILGMMSKLPIRNEFQAEQVARQAAADTATSTQDSLFGEEQVSESLYLERARILDAATKRLKKDKSTFRTLVEREGAIKDAGNKLDRAANEQRLQDADFVREYLTRQANTKGPVSDALSQAAKDLKAGGDTRQAVSRVIEAVRRSGQSRGEEGQARQGTGRGDEPAGAREEGESQQQDVTPPKTEPTEAGEQSVIPGAEQNATRSEQAREADQKREVDARQQQSRKGTAAPQEAPGGLFDTQGDLLDNSERSDEGGRDNDEQDASDEGSTSARDPDRSRAAVAKARRQRSERLGPQTVQGEPAEVGDTPSRADRIEDMGEKIGGARKDTATSTGPRGSRPKEADETPAWRKRYEVGEIAADAFDKSRVGKFTISDTRSKHGRIPGFGRRALDFDTREEAEAAIPMVAVARNHRVVSEPGGTFKIVRTISDRKRPTIRGGFESREAAQRYMAENAVEIIETKTRIDDSIHPALEQALRDGEARREGGRDVTGQDFMDIFGFRGVEFGNWNNNAERQHILNQGFDALLDMAEITDLPPKALSLNGELAIAFGARGHGLQGARAHYEMDYGVINLTKIKGAGALAHEWMHAVDHYFARQDGKAKSEKTANKRGDEVFDVKSPEVAFVSHSFRRDSGVRQEVLDAIKAVMDTIYKRRQEFTEDVSTREKVEERAEGRLDQVLKQFRDDLAREQQYGRKTAPATKQQLLKVDQQIKRIKRGDLGEMVEAPTKARWSKPVFHDPVLKLAEIYKEVRGRQAYGQRQGRNFGYAFEIQAAITQKQQADKFLADAKEQRTKEKTVRTEFASEAWKMDQGAKKDYWSTNHEMLARAFEAYVYDRLQEIDARNDFLAYEKHNEVPEYLLFQVKPYPEGQEREAINDAFRNLFDTIQTEETPEGTVRMYQRQMSAFYSPLVRALEGAKQKQAQAKDWKAIIAKMPGVKRAEIEWLGVEEWLDAQEGQVTREELAEFVRESQIEVVEDRLAGGRSDWGHGDVPPDSIAAEIAAQFDDDGMNFTDNDGNDITEVAEERGIRDADFEEENGFDQAYRFSDGTYIVFSGDAWDVAGTAAPDADGEPRFEEYTEPGGENYREVLLRVPNLHETGLNGLPAPIRAKVKSLTSEIEAIEAKVPNPTADGAFYNLTEADKKRYNDLTLERHDLVAKNLSGKDPFVQPAHFEQENIVVHARVKDRTGPNGEKVLFVEEIQSDLASVWRENQEDPEVTARRQELKEARDRIENARVSVYQELLRANPYRNNLRASDVPMSSVAKVISGDMTVPENPVSMQDRFLAEARDRILDESPEASGEGNIRAELLRLGTERRIPEGTPDTPFKEEHTYSLMTKRLLRMAAEEGYDRVSWTPGYMQAERWNKAGRSVVESVEWRRIPSGVKGGTLTMSGGNEIVFGVNETNGEITDSSSDELVGKQLSSLVGPGLAKQILQEESGSVSGQKITFPDSGYAIAYDQQTRKAVDKLAKGTGAKVYVDKTLPDMAPSGKPYGDMARQLSPSEFLSKAKDANAANDGAFSQEVSKIEGYLDEKAVIRGMSDEAVILDLIVISGGGPNSLLRSMFTVNGNPVWSIDITDDLRAKALEPMAILRRNSVLDEQKVRALLPDLKKRLDKLMIRDVDLRFEPGMAEQGATEVSPNDDIAILIGAALNDTATLNHEAIHVLRARNLFKNREWTALREAAEKDWMKRYDIEERYGDLGREAQVEEAVAEAFADWTQGKLTVEGDAKGPMARIKRFFKALLQALRGQNITSPADVFKTVESGAVGARDGASRRQAGRRLQRQPKRQRDGEAFSTDTIEEIARLNRESGQPLTPEQLDLPPGFEAPRRKGMTWFRELMQDKFVMFRAAEDVIEQTTGQKLPEAMSFASRETVFRGRTANRLEKVMKEEVRPITGAMSKEGVSLEDLGLYLVARHAPERNALMAKRNPERFGKGGGSGMTDETAAQVMQRFDEKGQTAALDRVAKLIDTMIKRDLKNRYLAGLISKAQYDSYRAMYENYTPLRGFAEREDGDQTGSTGAGFSVRGKDVIAATGRSSLSDNPVIQAIGMRQQGIVRAEKNRVGKALLRLVQKYRNPDIWEPVGKLPTREVLNKDTGMVQKITDFGAMDADEMLAVKVGGQNRWVRIKDPLMARAAKNMDDSLGDGLLAKTVNTVSRATRAWSRLQTGGNPDFVFPNGMSDLLEGVWTAYNVKDTRKMMRSYVRYYPVALYQGMKGEFQDSALGRKVTGGAKKALDRLTNNDMSQENLKKFDRYRKEWEAAGGRINFMAFRDLDEITRDINKEIRQADKRWWQVTPWQATEDMLAVIEKVNQPVESAGRLAMYVAAREQGLSKERAAALSLDASGNYYRRGRATRGLASFYAFFNPAVQGVEKFLRFSRRPRNWAVLGGVSTTAYSLALFNMGYWGDDDDPEETPLYLKIPEWERSRALIIPYGVEEVAVDTDDGIKMVKRLKYYAFRVPHNLRPLLMLGDQMAALSHAGKTFSPTKHTTPSDARAAITRTILMNNNPFGSENMLTAISPTVTDPFADILQNQAWHGGIVHPKQFPWTEGRPKSSQYFERSTPDYAVGMAQFLNEISGGDRWKAGAVDVYPDDIEHLFNYVTGGLGRFVERGAETVINTAQGVDTKTYRKPIVRSFSGETNQFAESDRYYTLREDLFGKRNNLRDAQRVLDQNPYDTEAQETRDRLLSEMNVGRNGSRFSWTNSTPKIFDKADGEMKELRDEISAVQQDTSLSRPDRIKRVDALQLRIEQIQKEARGDFIELLTEIGQNGGL